MAFKIPNFYQKTSPLRQEMTHSGNPIPEGTVFYGEGEGSIPMPLTAAEKTLAETKKLTKFDPADGRYDTFSGARNVLIDPNSESSRKMREAYKNDWGTDFDPSDENSVSYANSYYNSQSEDARNLMDKGMGHSDAMKESTSKRDNSFGHGNANFNYEKENMITDFNKSSGPSEQNTEAIDPQNINWSEAPPLNTQERTQWYIDNNQGLDHTTPPLIVAETEPEPIEEVMTSSAPRARNNRRTRRGDRIRERNEKAELRRKGIKGNAKEGIVDGSFKIDDQDFQDPTVS